jgi:tRNA G18 (ribose-2'-O)-methylase SpoU
VVRAATGILGAMARPHLVRSAGDPAIADYLRLTDADWRRAAEPGLGLFIAEGDKVIRRAVRAGHPVRSVLCAERWLEPLADLLEPLEAPVYVADEAVLREITGFEVHRGALAAMGRLSLPSIAHLAASSRRLLVLEGVVDPTNVGAAIRSAVALGFEGVVLDPRCADPLYRRAVKVSMGAVFTAPHARATRWPADLAALRDHGFALWALTPAAGAVDLGQISASPPERVALLVGTEGPGLSRHALAAADERVRIPMQAGVDSLNVAAAAAVACYALRPRTSPEGGDSPA